VWLASLALVIDRRRELGLLSFLGAASGQIPQAHRYRGRIDRPARKFLPVSHWLRTFSRSDLRHQQAVFGWNDSLPLAGGGPIGRADTVYAATVLGACIQRELLCGSIREVVHEDTRTVPQPCLPSRPGVRAVQSCAFPVIAMTFLAITSTIRIFKPSGGITRNSHQNRGPRFGFELTFFRQAVDRDSKRRSWDVRDLYVVHLALSDLDAANSFMQTHESAGPGIAV